MSELSLEREVGELLECVIGGEVAVLKRVEGHYDHEDRENRINCPVCGGLGIPWGGMFHCEFEGNGHKAIISTGQCFKVIGYDKDITNHPERKIEK